MITKPHFVQQDNILEGISLKQCEQVAALLIAANYDGLRFDRPERFIPDMQLARTKAQVALERLLTRFPNTPLADPRAPAVYTKRLGVHGLSKLVVKLA